MITVKSLKKAKCLISKERTKGLRLGFVPTMGALHFGHLSLIRKAKSECDFLIVSIFVNPLQFGPKEDFKKYPRNLAKDKKLLIKEGVDLLFCPDLSAMYPSGASVFVYEDRLSKVLCGESRPGHFKGVSTVLAKLFNIVDPDIAYFGQKDYQQGLIVKKLISDLNYNIRIRILPIIREADNLAMSSRNVYLSDKARKRSKYIYQSLVLARNLIRKGLKSTDKIISEMIKLLRFKAEAKIDYIQILDANALIKLKTVKGRTLIAVAIYIDNIRLIDNIIINVKK